MKKFHPVFRLLLALVSIALIACYYLPLWEIDLMAPQYPEGLTIYIWHNDIKGNIDIINGLNHYIGMKHIKVEMFPEFEYLKYIIAAFIAFGLFVSILGSRLWLKIFCVVVLLGGIVALADFYRWGYDYGHNLDPKAPIQVPGMSYQPPIIGAKDLLNFRAISMPASGGWVLVAVGLIAFTALFFDWFKNRKLKKSLAMMIPGILFLAGCSNSKPQFYFGKENCEYCKMTLMDHKFGVALESEKGRVYKFDDFACMKSFIAAEKPAISKTFVVLFDKPGEVEHGDQVVYGKLPHVIKSPMGSGIGFFTSEASFQKLFDNKGTTGKLEELLNE